MFICSCHAITQYTFGVFTHTDYVEIVCIYFCLFVIKLPIHVMAF